MIGVLAVIAILAAVLVPKVFNAIANSRVSNTSMSCNTVKQGIADHYAKFNVLNYDGTVSNTITPTPTGVQFDSILVAESFLDKPFAPRVGSGVGAKVVLLAAPAAEGGTVTAATGGPAAAADAYFDLSGSTTNTIAGVSVAVALIPGVTWEDAKALNAIIDGAALGETATGKDIQGRVKYDFTGATGTTAGTTTVYVYLTHR